MESEISLFKTEQETNQVYLAATHQDKQPLKLPEDSTMLVTTKQALDA
jgi:hypothetical protein